LDPGRIVETILWNTEKGCGMIRKILCLLLLVGCACVLNGQDKPPAEDPAAKWGKTIQEFEDWDRKNSYPSDAVLFVGSSSIKLWPTRESFDGLAVINRGFGGSQISEVNYFADRIVLRYAPKVIVFYAGDNDVAAGKSAERVFDDYREFVKIVHQKLPRTRIIFIAIKPSGRRWSLWPVMAKANRMIEELAGSDDRLMYFDSATPLLADDGRPDTKFFLKDNLHLNADGYRLWTRLLRPIVEEAVKPSTRRR
jgi:lysophospholipase L1-like esterase